MKKDMWRSLWKNMWLPACWLALVALIAALLYGLECLDSGSYFDVGVPDDMFKGLLTAVVTAFGVIVVMAITAIRILQDILRFRKEFLFLSVNLLWLAVVLSPMVFAIWMIWNVFKK